MGYFEVYGMGIELGDLIELCVVVVVFGGECIDFNLLLLGLVKMNIGYLEVVVGMVGIIKVLFVI